MPGIIYILYVELDFWNRLPSKAHILPSLWKFIYRVVVSPMSVYIEGGSR